MIQKRKNLLLPIIAAGGLAFTGSSQAQTHECIDSDGDGYGWDGANTCLIADDSAMAECIDSDGDGYGWDGAQSCIIPGVLPLLHDCRDYDGDGYGWNGLETCLIDTTAATTDLSIQFSGLDALGDDYVYEGWILVNGAPVSTGRFSDNDSVVQQITASDAELATKYILTIEPAVGDDPAPASTHVLAGDITAEGAVLTIGDPAAVGSDFVNSTGSFIVETPSSEATDDFDQGIWWVNPGVGASLNLPTLPEGWEYEGWVVTADGPLSTGRFTDPAAPDSDGAGPAAGPNPTPPVPGQDYINPAMSVIGLAAVISVEPQPDNSPAPFGIKPLIDGEIENVGPGVPQDMANVTADNQPSGVLTIGGGS